MTPDADGAVSGSDANAAPVGRHHGVPRLIATLALACLALQFTVLPQLGSSTTLPQPLPVALLVLLFVVAFAAAESAVMHVPSGRTAYTVTLGEIPLVVGLFFLTPGQFVAARLLGAAVTLAWRNRHSARKLLFNVVLHWLEALAAVAVWQLAVGSATGLVPVTVVAAAGVAVMVELMATAAITAAMTLDAKQSLRPRGLLAGATPVVSLVNASAALAVVYVISVDWRALWTVGIVVAVVLFAQRSHNALRRRTEAVEQLGTFTGDMGNQLDLESAVVAASTWMTEVLWAEVVEVTLSEDFAGRRRRWVCRYQKGVTEVAGDGLSDQLAPWLAAGPLLVPRRSRDRALTAAMSSVELRDAVAMHLPGDDEVMGTLLVGSRLGEAETFSESDLHQLQALGNHLSVTLRNARRADLIREHADDQVRRSMHDELTGLPNRRQIEQRLSDLHVAGRRSVAILLDLDRFKEINDTLGHDTGDALLQMVADRLLRCVPTDATVARLGGDEYAVVIEAQDDATAESVVSLVRHALAVPFELHDLRVTVEASVGVASSGEGVEPRDVLRHADIAMYAAKAGRTGVETYRRELEVVSPARLTLLTDLKDAITHGQLAIHVQPKVQLRDGVVLAAEALVRWEHPERGIIGPDEFIPVAEHSGLITPLTYWVLHQSLAACESWRRAGWAVGVAVNISPRSLAEPSFVDEVARALAAVEVPADAVTLEITESSLMADPERAIEALERLRSLGLHLSIDDLGTGYSSLAYLQRLPVSEVKIDKSFLRPDDQNASSLAIVAAIVDLGHRLGRRVVAEGVEDEATWQLLQQLGCDSAQGYWMGRPMPAADFVPWLEQWRPRRVAGLRALA